MLKKEFILIYVFVLMYFLQAASFSRLCERMTKCDLFRHIRTHKKKITAVNEKTVRVDFLINELQTAGNDLMLRIDVLEENYQNISEQVSSFFRPHTTEDHFDFQIIRISVSTVYISNRMKEYRNNGFPLGELGKWSNEGSGDYKQSILDLNQVQRQLLDNFTDVKNDFEDLKEKVSLSVSGAAIQAFQLQGMREDLNRGDDSLRSLETILQHHFEELELIIGSHPPDYDIISINSEISELNERYSELESEVSTLVSNLGEKEISQKTDSAETDDNMRYARDELKSLKSSIATLMSAVNDTQHECIDGGLELASKMRALQRRIKNIGRRKSNCWG